MTNIFKPILFSTEMVQAILAGRKTQTRRVVKNQPPTEQYKPRLFKDHFGKLLLDFSNTKVFLTESTPAKCQPGDILWVRETFAKPPITAFGVPYIHKAGFDRTICGWKHSIHMPKEAARIFLKVTNVRCERLQEISEGDSISEGVELFDTNRYKDYEDKKSSGVRKARVSFATLWDSINAKKHPWKSNPWVWVYDFERIEKPENFIS